MSSTANAKPFFSLLATHNGTLTTQAYGLSSLNASLADDTTPQTTARVQGILVSLQVGTVQPCRCSCRSPIASASKNTKATGTNLMTRGASPNPAYDAQYVGNVQHNRH